MGSSASIFSGATSFMGSIQQSSAERTQGEYQKQQLDTNSRLATMAAEDSVTRGEKAAGKRQEQTNQTIGAEQAGIGAQGIDINSGSAGDVQRETRALGASDIATIQANAWREAWGHQVESLDSEYKGKFAQRAADRTARSTLLTGGLQFVKGLGMAGGESKKNNESRVSNTGSDKKESG